MASATGYVAGFLGPAVPLPGPADTREATRLDYPHFSVLVDHARRLAITTGVNVDGAGLVAVPRSGRWHLDPRLDRQLQAGADVYADNDLDRGHLVRRRDPGWGDDAVAATEATFSYPNAAPQAASFNQSSDLWLGVEDHVLEYAASLRHRISVFTAPVLGADDPPYRGIRIPLRFWKAVAWADDDGALAATGFVLDQSEAITDVDGTATVAPLGRFRTFQVPLSDIAALTGVDLGPLVTADVYPPGSVPGAGAGAGERMPEAVGAAAWTELHSSADVRLSRRRR
ncbi:DNA/RNA non-specific endonuclease [Microbacterium sp.]|uniref:DNA/RNA non-specific endonuclease n=1 Tax=Microbacterium sp. TaxID=51671 RepID=UPI003A850DB8